MQVFRKAFVASRERTRTDTGGVGFANTDDTLDRCRWQARTGAGTTSRGVRGSDKWIGAEIDIEQTALCAFEKDCFAVFPGFVKHRDDIGNVRGKTCESGEHFIGHLLGIELRQVEFCQNFIGIGDAEFDLFAEVRWT